MFLMFGFCVAGCEQRDEVVERKGVEEGEAIDEKVAPVLVDVEILNPVGMEEPAAAWKVAFAKKIQASEGPVGTIDIAELAVRIFDREFTEQEMKFWLLGDGKLSAEEVARFRDLHMLEMLRYDVGYALKRIARTDPKWSLRYYYQVFRGVGMRVAEGSDMEVDDSWLPQRQLDFSDNVLEAILYDWLEVDWLMARGWMLRVEKEVVEGRVRGGWEDMRRLDYPLIQRYEKRRAEQRERARE